MTTCWPASRSWIARVASIPSSSRQADVHQHDIGRLLFDQPDGLVTVECASDDDEPSVAVEDVCDERAELLVVLADHDAEWGLQHGARSLTHRPLGCGSDHRRPQRPRPAPLAGRADDAPRSRRGARGRVRRWLLRPLHTVAEGAATRTRPHTGCRCRTRSRTSRLRGSPRSSSPLSCELPVARATSTADFRPDRVTAIVHMEGAEPIAPDLSNLDGWYGRGLRSIGLTWSRPNQFAEGVPFHFPGSSDTGGGLTPPGASSFAPATGSASSSTSHI